MRNLSAQNLMRCECDFRRKSPSRFGGMFVKRGAFFKIVNIVNIMRKFWVFIAYSEGLQTPFTLFWKAVPYDTEAYKARNTFLFFQEAQSDRPAPRSVRVRGL